jgi:glycosyltransferase involved in cell wall biosynthesis
LISAYACEPGRGSEPGAGWAWATAAAANHRVWLVTSRRHAEPIRAALADDRPEGLEEVLFLEDLTAIRHRGQQHLAYWRWQRAARPVFARLHAEHAFDLAHHLTWAVDWQPSAAASIPGVPYVWGPVGGVTAVPLRMARWLGLRGFAAEVARELAIRPVRRVAGGGLARNAALALVQNEDGRRRFGDLDHLDVAPNVAVDVDGTARNRRVGQRRAVFAGRLVAWKGIRLAVAAIAHAPGWVLDVYGDGPDRVPATRLARRLGVEDRITFHGRRPRPEVLDELAGADALLFPSLREAAGWVVAEAVSLGVPVVCLDRGGPPELARVPTGGISVRVDRHAPRGLAAALDRVPDLDPTDWWALDRLPSEIDRHYRRAVAAGR